MSTSWLRGRMRQYAEAPALVWLGRIVSYRSLLKLADCWHGLIEQGKLGASQVVAIEGDFSPRACALLLALAERPSVAVPLTSNSLSEKKQFLQIAEAQVIVRLGVDDTWTIEQRPVGVKNPLTRRLLDAQEAGLVLFSSGSSGQSKAALHSFPKLLEKFKQRRHRMRTIAFLLLDHIGGINTLFYTLSNGGTLVTLESRDPEAVCCTIERHRAQLLPTSPTFLNLLLMSEAHTRHDLASLELITYGTEVMPRATLKRLTEAFPHVKLLQTYGLSELGILRSKSKGSGSLWVKIGGDGFETRVIERTLWIRARSAMIGYLNAPDPFDNEGWFNTQDVVEVDGEHLRILGRASDLINVGGRKVYPAEVESVLLEMPNVKDAVVYGEKNPIMGEIVAARVNLLSKENPAAFRRRLRQFCKGRLARYKTPLKVRIVEDEQFTGRYKKNRAEARLG